jgi:hypothetical protein
MTFRPFPFGPFIARDTPLLTEVDKSLPVG